MANKIQLRRDTTANWNNVNPILADGEPGLDITTNQIKYGDGANAWVDLSYASGGLSGNLTLPEGSTITDTASAPGFSNGQAVEIKPGGGNNDNQLLKIYPTNPSTDGNHIHITSGNLSVTDLFFGDDDQFVQIAADGNVCVGTSGNIWQFGTNGNLTFPDSTTQSTAFDITKFGEGFSLTAADKIVTNKLYSTNATQPTQHYRLELDTNGVVVLPDQSIINGSTIRGIHGTGELNYTGITIGPNVAYQEESWMYVDHSGAYIATKYNTDQKLWQFDNTGNLTFPDSTTQSTAYKRTTGSWTVATGSGTYSFTVPLNGTYAMWVKGNIPDGIIAWNATATVTNNNVPVIGQQYAWNYTGGGTPLEITAMPTQFVGTANTIVSSNPSVGSNSNVFNFTINNGNVSAQTVYWGYVTQ